MKKITLPVSEFAVLEGIVKEGEKKGQEYSFIKLDQRITNNKEFITACKEAGVKVVKDGAVSGGSAGFEISEE